MKRTLVLGASPNQERYSYMAVEELRIAGHDVVAVGNRGGQIKDITIQTNNPSVDELDTVTIYLNPMKQTDYYDYILNLNPRRIIFNPGTENIHLEDLAKEKGIETTNSCTLVLLKTGFY